MIKNLVRNGLLYSALAGASLYSPLAYSQDKPLSPEQHFQEYVEGLPENKRRQLDKQKTIEAKMSYAMALLGYIPLEPEATKPVEPIPVEPQETEAEKTIRLREEFLEKVRKEKEEEKRKREEALKEINKPSEQVKPEVKQDDGPKEGESWEDYLKRLDEEIKQIEEENNKPKTPSKIQVFREPRSSFRIHSLGGAQPNGTQQGHIGLFDFDASLKEWIKIRATGTSSSTSFIDINGRQTIINSPFNGYGGVGFDLRGLKLETILLGSFQEVIRRDSSYIQQVIGTSTIDVHTRTKTREIDEQYAVGALIEMGPILMQAIGYGTIAPTIVENEIFQKVVDSANPSASFTSNLNIRPRSFRNNMQGVKFKAGARKYFSEMEQNAKKENILDYWASLEGSLIGFAQKREIDDPSGEKRELQRIFGGMNFQFDTNNLAAWAMSEIGYLDDKIGDVRYRHEKSGIMGSAGIIFDAYQIRLFEERRKSKDPKIEEIVDSVRIPILVGATFDYNASFETRDKNYTEFNFGGILGLGTAFSGRTAIESITSLERQLAEIDIGAAAEYGDRYGQVVRNNLIHLLPLDLIKPNDWKNFGALGILRVGSDQDNHTKYEGLVYGIFGPFSAQFKGRKEGHIKEWGVGLGYSLTNWARIGLEYSELDQPNQKRTPTIAMGITIGK